MRPDQQHSAKEKPPLHRPDGGPAFPVGVIRNPFNGQVERADRLADVGGMTLRDYFAGQALASICAANAIGGGPTSQEIDAEWCYRYADAMIEARETDK